MRDDLDAPRKQRHAVKRILDRLLDERDRKGIVTCGMVRDYVGARRREAEVDFGDVAIRLRGELATCALFSLRLSCSGRAVQIASVPLPGRRRSSKAAVASVIGFSRQRVGADRWTAFRSQCGIEAF